MNNKVEVMFKIYFSFSSVTFTNDIKNFYFIFSERRRYDDKLKINKSCS